jgi:hypothetical protein
MVTDTRFIWSDGHRGGNYLKWWVTVFFPYIFLFSFRKDNEMKSWMGTTTSGQEGQTRGPVSVCEVDIRQETKESTECFFTDL